MAGSDIAILWVNADGTGSVSDRSSSGHNEPLVDASQDWTLTEKPVVSSGQTTFRLERLRTTGDTGDIDITDAVRSMLEI